MAGRKRFVSNIFVGRKVAREGEGEGERERERRGEEGEKKEKRQIRKKYNVVEAIDRSRPGREDG